MPDRHTVTVELLKYPLLVFSILIALVLMKHLLGLEFGVITEVSTQGVKFAEHNKATVQSLGEHESRLNEIDVRIAALEQRIQSVNAESRQTQLNAFSAAQMVSDKTAQISTLQKEVAPAADALRGYIWIGNYDQAWESPKLARLDTGQPVDLAPPDMLAGTEYTVLGNMVVRDGLPDNNKEYFRGRENLGVVPRGGRVVLLKSPVGIDREFAVQYWVEVEVIDKP